MDRKIIIGRTLLILVALIIGLGLTELSLRLFKPQKTEQDYSPGFSFRCFTTGTYYWLALKPNSHCSLSSTAGDFKNIPVDTNSIGLRNPEIILPKPHDTFRILFIGDSFTMGWGVKEDQAFPRVVEKLLQSHFPQKHIEVINAGLAGTDPGYYYLFLKNEGLAMDPDIVIVNVYPYNDLGMDMPNAVWGSVDEQGLPTTISSSLLFIDTTGQIREKAQPLKLSVPILRRSHLWALIADAIRPPKYLYLPQTNVNAILCLYDERCTALDPIKKQFEQLLNGMKQLTNRQGISLILINIPPEFAIDEGKRLKYSMTNPVTQLDVRALRRDIVEMTQAEGIAYIPIRQTLFDHYLEHLWFIHDDHWNAKGHEVVAQTIANNLFPLIASSSAALEKE